MLLDLHKIIEIPGGKVSFTCEPDLADPQRGRHLNSCDDLVLVHHFMVLPSAHALFGHTVPAAQIALNREGNPQVCNIAS